MGIPFMKDPMRLLDESGSTTTMVRTLLQSGRQMGPPADAVERGWQDFLALNRVSFPVASATAQVSVRRAQAVGAARSASKALVPAAILAKTFAAGAMLGVVAMLGARAVEHVRKPTALPIPSVITLPAGQHEVGGAGTAVPANPATSDLVTDDSHASAPPGSRDRAAETSGSNEGDVRAAPVPSAEPSVAAFPVDGESIVKAEARDVSEAKAMIARGRSTEALAFLGRSAERFKYGTLGQEREALIIEALAASGQRAAALARARDFLVKNPRSPLTERVKRATQ
jgi:hypothetical protein